MLFVPSHDSIPPLFVKMFENVLLVYTSPHGLALGAGLRPYAMPNARTFIPVGAEFQYIQTFIVRPFEVSKSPIPGDAPLDTAIHGPVAPVLYVPPGKFITLFAKLTCAPPPPAG